MLSFKDYIKEQHDIEYKDEARYIFSRNTVWEPRDKSGLMLADLKPGPYAVWYGIGRQWLDWMRINSPKWISNYNAIFEIQVNDVLLLDTADKVRQFDEMAGVREQGSDAISEPLLGLKAEDRYKVIDWNLVATQYKGVEFNPYLHSIRHEYLWYSSIDLSSGVIFDPVRGITDAKLVWKR